MTTIILLNIILSLLFSFLAPILPLEIRRRHISQTYIGFILGVMCLGYIVCLYFVTELAYSTLGRRGTSLLGFFIMSVALLLYGLAYFVPDQHKSLFKFCSLFTRFFEGVGLGIASPATVALIAKLFPSELGRATSARFLGSYSGITIGVVVGALVREVVGYFGVFLIFSITVGVSSFLIFVFDEDSSPDLRYE